MIDRLLGTTLESLEARIYERALAAARAGLSEAEFSAAWTEGERMTLEEAIAYALKN